MRAHVDFDWADYRRSRKSTSRGDPSGGMAAKAWSSMQRSIATSSGESEHYALARGHKASPPPRATQVGVLKIRLWVDSSANAAAGRIGLGRTRHIEVRFRWLQEAVRQRRLELCKISVLNPADASTKPKPLSEF